MFKFQGITTMLCIDGSNTHTGVKSLNYKLDYAKLYRLLENWFDLASARYYTAIREDNRGVIDLQPLIDYLSFNNYVVVSKPIREYVEVDPRTGTNVIKIKGNMDLEMVVDMFEMQRIEHIVLMTGDGDFVEVVKAMQRRGVRMTVVSTTKSNPPMVSNDLRRACDHFVDLADLRKEIELHIQET